MRSKWAIILNGIMWIAVVAGTFSFVAGWAYLTYRSGYDAGFQEAESFRTSYHLCIENLTECDAYMKECVAFKRDLIPLDPNRRTFPRPLDGPPLADN